MTQSVEHTFVEDTVCIVDAALEDEGGLSLISAFQATAFMLNTSTPMLTCDNKLTNIII